MIGKRFERLIVVAKSCKRSKSREIYWECECDCGNRHLATTGSLKSKSVKSCGCLKKELSGLRAKILFTKPKKKCSVRDCDHTTEKGAWGFCGMHYQRMRRYGDLNYKTPEDVRALKQRLSLLQTIEAKKDTYRKFYGRHEHRVLGEKIAGRTLKTEEHVHHKDENKHNNLLSNLEVMTREEHLKHHAKIKAIPKRSD